MRRYLYLSTAVAGVMMTAGAGASYAQCVTTQNCAELGYTETSCPDGTGIKCPFGDTFACTGGSCANDCDKLGFKYACTGTGYSGGSGTACGGKYAACTCASGYEWKNGSCQQQLNGAQGDLYYCNGKVVGVRATGMGFYVAMKDLGLMYWSSANSQCQSYSFCGNVKGTLPTREQLLSIYQNKSRVDSLLSTNGGTQLTNGYYWSSTGYSYDDYFYYFVLMSNGNSSWNSLNNNLYVRPVLASW